MLLKRATKAALFGGKKWERIFGFVGAVKPFETITVTQINSTDTLHRKKIVKSALEVLWQRSRGSWIFGGTALIQWLYVGVMADLKAKGNWRRL